MQACKLKPCTLRPLPLHSPCSSIVTTITGRPVRSTSRDATMPMTPGVPNRRPHSQHHAVFQPLRFLFQQFLPLALKICSSVS